MSLRTLASYSSEIASIGDAVAVTILLRDWEAYGLTERVCYHFDLTETLTATFANSSVATAANDAVATANQQTPPLADVMTTSATRSHDLVCGVAALLDCVPTTAWHKLSKRQRKILRNAVREWNRKAHKAMYQQRNVACYEPKVLPLRLTPSTRVMFGYQVTRIAFVLDASPSLTTAFGSSGSSSASYLDDTNTSGSNNKFSCALDRLPHMARTFFTSLVDKIETSSFIPESGPWQPRLAVSVIAVFPRKRPTTRIRNPRNSGLVERNETDDIDFDLNVLVRDACVNDRQSAELLADNIEEWAMEEVESEIARRVSRNQSGLAVASAVGGSFDDAWTIPLYVSSLEDLLSAADASLSIMSSQARPVIVLATDGRSVDCDSPSPGLLVADDDKFNYRVDVPLIVLDLSSPDSHLPTANTVQSGGLRDASNFLTDDPGTAFPLHLSDDSEVLYGICRATGGCFFDAHLLKEASTNLAGTVDPDSPLSLDRLLSFKRLTFRPNVIQWYTLFSVSPLSPPLSPAFHSLWGRLVPPHYLKQHFVEPDASHLVRETERRFSTMSKSTSRVDMSRQTSVGSASVDSQRKIARTTLSAYMVSPIRIKGLILLRIKEGYRAKQYWQSTQDGDKVFIEFALQLENGTILHYDLSYKPQLEYKSPMIGRAQVKIELSGDYSFIQSVKNDFLSRSQRVRGSTVAQKESARLCEVLRWMRKEDCLQSYICPVEWGDKLSSPDTPFVRRLGTLSRQQQFLHFRFDEFDVVCLGDMPYAYDNGILSDFFDFDNGEQSLFDTLSEWSTQTIQDQKLYVRKTSYSDSNLSSYCILEIVRSPIASRLFTIIVKYFGGSCAFDRMTLLESLKGTLQDLKDIEVLPKQMAQYLVGLRNTKPSKRQKLLESHHLHENWDLVNDPELLPLLTKRRTDIGKFRLLHSSDDYALFANLVSGSGVSEDSAMELFQYQIAILSDKVVIDVQMECESGKFFPFRAIKADESGEVSRFYRLVRTLKRRDQECSRALQARTSLLQAFQGDFDDSPVLPLEHESDVASVEILLPYSSRMSRRLRFFRKGSGSANSALQKFLEEFMLSSAFGTIRVIRLSIECTTSDFGGVGEGAWFIIQFDQSTISIVQLGLVDQVDLEGNTFREVTFFTSSISDLYSTRYEGADDESTDDHVSEYLSVCEFADNVEKIHDMCFAAAAYLALLDDPSVVDFHTDDFARIEGICDFVEVAQAFVDAGGSDSAGGVSLFRVFESILRPVPGDEYCFFYSGSIPKQDENLEANFEPFLDDEDHHHDSASDSDGESETQGRLFQQDENLELSGPFEFDSVWTPVIFPVFVRFSIDGKLATVRELSMLDGKLRLAAHLSLFKHDHLRQRRFAGSQKYMPWSHSYVATELRTHLDSYVAERTMERLRHVQSVEDVDLGIVKKCLRKARNVVSSVIDLFFVSKSDVLAHASTLANSDTDMDGSVSLFLRELQRNQTIQLKLVSKETYVVVPTSEDDRILEYWAFIDVRKRLGAVSVDVYHPAGVDMASVVTSQLREFVLLVVRRVNQLILLERLHRSRTASPLLIPEDEPNLLPFESFQCPVVFSTSFRLYHRCAANPSQVALSLQSTVLHSFAVSNRRDVFVYKDETGSIFYLLLRATAGETEVDGNVELLVHGVQSPGPSVTQQLKRLLQKRVLLIAVDMFSTVLAKNPNFKWASGDVELLRSFETEWGSLEEHDSSPQVDSQRMYKFPEQVFDPLIVLLMFRQNFCGSTFFHRLYEAVADTDAALSSYEAEIIDEDTEIKFDEREFKFYYNNTPSKLNPSYQAVSTLTNKGMDYSRKTGTGMALIELSLVFNSSEERSLQKLRTGSRGQEADILENLLKENLRFARVAHDDSKSLLQKCSLPLVAVRITDTALNRAALHDWVELTLNQSLVAWNIERHLQHFEQSQPLAPEPSKFPPDLKNSRLVHSLLPGLPALTDILESSHSLPHPAVEKTELNGVIRASSVAATTLEMLENCILGVLPMDSKELLKVSTIRLSRSHAPRIVQLTWVSNGRDRSVQVSGLDPESHIISDAPTDCPEYMCSSWFSLDNPKKEDLKLLPMLFSEVMIDDGIGDKNVSNFNQILETLKKARPSSFRHSFGFIFSVKRNKRILLTYNWDPQVLNKVAFRLREKDNANLAAAGRSMHEQQLRCLKLLCPPPSSIKSKPIEIVGTMNESGQTKPTVSKATPKLENFEPPQDTTDIEGERTGISRKVHRPLAIRRPKLIGKSVDGAAMQAVAASRARASSNRFRGNISNTATATTSSRKLQAANISSDQDPIADAATSKPPLVKAIGTAIRRGNDDEQILRLRKDFETKMFDSMFSRQSALQINVIRNLTSCWWPSNPGLTTSPHVLNFLLSQSVATWDDACHLPVMPRSLSKAFLNSFVPWIGGHNTGLRPVYPSSQSQGFTLDCNPAIIAGVIRRVRCCKCFAVARLAFTQMKDSLTLHCAGYILTTLRKSLTPKAYGLAESERDSAGLGKLSSDLRAMFALDSLVFDFISSFIEQAMKLKNHGDEEFIPVLRALATWRPLAKSYKTSLQCYQIFEANIVLDSYKNKFISMFDEQTLLRALVSNAENFGLLRCGLTGLCFIHEICVRGVRSTCFLSENELGGQMKILVLCWTGGKSLYEYIFRDESNEAVTLLDAIAMEAAGLAHSVLSATAITMRRDMLWKSCMSSMHEEGEEYLQMKIEGLTELASVVPVVHHLKKILDFESLDWTRFFSLMDQDPFFSPSRSFRGASSVLHLFYIPTDNVFLRVRIDMKGEILEASLLLNPEQKSQVAFSMALQRISNYLLHFVWSNL